jgi:hypothetical protein
VAQGHVRFASRPRGKLPRAKRSGVPRKPLKGTPRIALRTPAMARAAEHGKDAQIAHSVANARTALKPGQREARAHLSLGFSRSCLSQNFLVLKGSSDWVWQPKNPLQEATAMGFGKFGV